MVKGVSRNVIVVKPPEQSVFEEAIFIVRRDFIGTHGSADALEEAQKAAGAYLQCTLGVRGRTFSPVLLWIVCAAVILIAAALVLLLR